LLKNTIGGKEITYPTPMRGERRGVSFSGGSLAVSLSHKERGT
jgi:hypothetical protein